LEIVPGDGSGPPVGVGSVTGADPFIRFSNDSKYIVFLGSESISDLDLTVVDSDGSSSTVIAKDVVMPVHLSADNLHVAFLTTVTSDSGQHALSANVATLAGSVTKLIVDADPTISFSPDGQYVLLETSGPTYVYKSDGSGNPVTLPGAMEFYYSPDGHHLAGLSDFPPALSVFEPDGSGSPVPITLAAPIGGQAPTAASLAFSNDSQSIAVWVGGAMASTSTGTGLYIVRADSSGSPAEVATDIGSIFGFLNGAAGVGL
jgi:hypothetical protein